MSKHYLENALTVCKADPSYLGKPLVEAILYKTPVSYVVAFRSSYRLGKHDPSVITASYNQQLLLLRSAGFPL